jgi:ATP-dependent exoDNAse (exonuclease V) alpha subunit
MAIYRLSAQLVKRSGGRSVTAAAAYRAGVKIADERTGLVFDFRRRRGVVHAEIITPSHAPAWTRDRARLWNAVETVEKRKDAQLARELQLALPHELTDRQRLELTRQFVREEFVVARGMIADFAVHRPDKRGDYRNHHVHVLLTTRVISANGFGQKDREWNDVSMLEGWRAAWSDAVNRALALHGHAARVDHRSYAEQGINREPEPKVGPIATVMERRGRPSHAGADRRAVQARNQRRAELADILVTPAGHAGAAARTDQLNAKWAAPRSPTGTQSLPVRPLSAPVAPSGQRRARSRWRRRLFSLWSKVARAVTLPVRFLAATARRRPRNVDLTR